MDQCNHCKEFECLQDGKMRLIYDKEFTPIDYDIENSIIECRIKLLHINQKRNGKQTTN